MERNRNISEVLKGKEQRAYAYFWDQIPGIGSKTVLPLLERAGTPAELYHMSEKAAKELMDEKKAEAFLEQKRQWDVWGNYEQLEEKGIGFTWCGQEDYPRRLKNIPDPPFAVYVKGCLPSDDIKSVAIVGARKCSAYGQHVAQMLGAGLADAGIQVVSGMAMGIDGISQKAALSQGGKTFGVLGCGVDVCYPACHRQLYEGICSQGGVLSTYSPGTQPRPELFPPRNRIISGLADVLVVVEAKQKSGTLITVDMALEQGKEIYCVPGRVTDRLSDGCNKLIAQGAGILLSPEDLVEKIKAGAAAWQPRERAGTKGREASHKDFNRKSASEGPIGELMPGNNFSPRERLLYKLLDFDPVSAEQLHLQMITQGERDLRLEEVLELLWELILKGKADTVGGCYYVRR